MTDEQPAIIIGISGGKDSAAMALHLQELGLQYRAVFCDTGWEHAETYKYLRDVLPSVVGPIEWRSKDVPLEGEKLAIAEDLEGLLGHTSAMVRLCLHKGMFPSRVMRWCTQGLKTEIVREAIFEERQAGKQVVNAVGIRAEESARRAKMPETEWVDYYDALVWRPLIDWTLDDVIAIHKRHNLLPNPLYLQKANRVGCWPCIYARKAELRFLAETDPDRVEVLRRLEAYVAEIAAERRRRNGLEIKNAPTWFQARTGGTGDCWPIDKVMDWSMTSHGGRQVEAFAATPEDTGCMRWGLCEAETKGLDAWLSARGVRGYL
jgi:3'-phosphoadenosine 5'-phosphosulfate sulfotransferase (PAPS reductase)/FAD synthetase